MKPNNGDNLDERIKFDDIRSLTFLSCYNYTVNTFENCASYSGGGYIISAVLICVTLGFDLYNS